jgi:hypothetical protein
LRRPDGDLTPTAADEVHSRSASSESRRPERIRLERLNPHFENVGKGCPCDAIAFVDPLAQDVELSERSIQMPWESRRQVQ